MLLSRPRCYDGTLGCPSAGVFDKASPARWSGHVRALSVPLTKILPSRYSFAVIIYQLPHPSLSRSLRVFPLCRLFNNLSPQLQTLHNPDLKQTIRLARNPGLTTTRPGVSIDSTAWESAVPELVFTERPHATRVQTPWKHQETIKSTAIEDKLLIIQKGCCRCNNLFPSTFFSSSSPPPPSRLCVACSWLLRPLGVDSLPECSSLHPSWHSALGSLPLYLQSNLVDSKMVVKPP